MHHKTLKNKGKIFAVAPMMDWTDRHCRVFHRLLTERALLYTEMVTTGAVLHGDRARLLRFSADEHPVALQLGGSEPDALASAARIAADFGYDEINLNIGCPSDRVQSGRFGACLMAEPELVGRCVTAMKKAVSVPITVKCRIGIDDQDPEPALDALADAVVDAGVDAIWVHARKAWLEGLSPKQNRDVPPLDYERVYRLKQRLNGIFIGINGGILTLDEARIHRDHVDGVMLGRAAYKSPSMLAAVDRAFFDTDGRDPDRADVVERFLPYIDRELAAGVHLSHITRHMLGLFQGVPGARAWRRILTVESVRPGANSDVVRQALGAVRGQTLDMDREFSDRERA